MAASAILEIEEVVSWLKSVEQRVGSVYTKAAEYFINKDEEFAGFLGKLGEDEKLHAAFMTMISEKLTKIKKTILLDVILDEKTVDDIEGLLGKFENVLAQKSISKKQIIEYMARAESCELNPVFLYIAGTFGRMNREAEYITSEIQSHLWRIQDFIGTLNRELKPSVNIDAFTSVWDSKFLIVDDNEPLRKLIGSLLSYRGYAEVASGGSEGMEMVRKHFYNGIVSDIEMPGMDGLEFYRQAVEYDPRLRQNFLFYSAEITPRREKYLHKNNIPYLHKPFGLTEFHNIIDRFLRGNEKIE